MSDEELAVRRAIISACLTMNAHGINQGKSGNISARFGRRLQCCPVNEPV